MGDETGIKALGSSWVLIPFELPSISQSSLLSLLHPYVVKSVAEAVASS